MLSGDRVVLFFKRLQTARQRVGDLRLVVLVFWAGLVVVHGGLHLPDRLDQALGLFGQLVLLISNGAQLAMERLGERREQL